MNDPDTPAHHLNRCRVVIVGAGFGGLAAAARLAGNHRVDLTVIDAHDHHLFQPLLYQVATAALSPSDIAAPIRSILPDTRVLMANVTAIDVAARQVHCGDLRVPYDELILATGSQANYFGHLSWQAAAPALKSLDDATSLRRTILEAFEQAVVAKPDARTRLLTFVLIGGGPTGVELAGSIAELSRDLLAQAGLPGSRARIVLVEAEPHILAGFAPHLSHYAAATLRHMGVELREHTKVTAIEPGQVHLGEDSIAAGTIIWTAGTQATPVAKWLGVQPGHGGRVQVGRDLRLADHQEIAVIGDVALAHGANGKPFPGLAPVAKQQGNYVARAILRRLRRAPPPRPFAYRDYGTLATIGRNRAVAELGSVQVTGTPAWLLWAVVHIFFLVGFRNRFMVVAQWAFAYASNTRPGQLIIRPQPDQSPLPDQSSR